MDKIDFLDYNRLEDWLESQVNKERQRIHQDAHDKVYNRLAALAHITENAIDGENIPKETLKHLNKSLREINAELQRIINYKQEKEAKEKDKQIIEKLGHICRDHVINYNQELEITCWPNKELDFEPDDFWQIECILQECLNNIGKHSKAEVVQMSIETSKNHYIVKVKDNGKGIKAQDINKGSGFKSLYERANKLGGRININSGDDGTNITLKIPIAN